MRIDSHHSYTERYTLEYLETILKRNRFEGSILVTAPPLPATLPGYIQGVVLRLDPANGVPDHPLLRGVCYEVAALPPRGLPLDLIANPASAAALAREHPEQRIALVHLGTAGMSNDDQWAAELAEAAAHPNVYCKLSGVGGLPFPPKACVQLALRLFGAERLMFGSDWPAGLPEISWKASLAAFTQAIGAQPMELREELLGGTAGRFYGV